MKKLDLAALEGPPRSIAVSADGKFAAVGEETGKIKVFDLATGQMFYIGTNSPNGVITASPGSIFLSNAGGAGATLFIHENAATNSTWAAK